MASPYDVSIEAVLFDMDGTLVNSIAAAESMWTRLADQAGLPAAEVIRYSHGRQIADSVARFLPDRSPAQQERITRQLMREELEEAAAVTEIAGAAALMTALIDNGVPVALVTSAVRELALARMHYAGVPIPPVVVTAEDVDNGKPAPDAYLQAAASLGVPTARCVVFEDAEAGLRSARASGAQVVVVGDHLSPTTEGLTRIRGYQETRVSVDDGTIRLILLPS